MRSSKRQVRRPESSREFYPSCAICKAGFGSWTCDTQMPLHLLQDRQSILGGFLLRAAQKRATQTRFAPNGGVAVNDATLGCLIDRGDERANLIHIRFFRRAHLFMHRAHARNRAAVAERTLQCLARAIGGGFRVGHLIDEFTGRGESRRNAQLSRCRSCTPSRDLAAEIYVPRPDDATRNTAFGCGGRGAIESVAAAASARSFRALGKRSGTICTIAPSGS